MSNRNLPTLNVPAFVRLFKWISVEQGLITDQLIKAGFADWPKWNQETWGQEVRNGVCQTSCCFAGAAAVQAGYDFGYSESYYTEWSDDLDVQRKVYAADYVRKRVKNGLTAAGTQRYKLSSKVEWIPDVAREVLGLTDDEGSELFAADNDYDDLVRIFQRILHDRGLPKIKKKELRK